MQCQKNSWKRAVSPLAVGAGLLFSGTGPGSAFAGPYHSSSDPYYRSPSTSYSTSIPYSSGTSRFSGSSLFHQSLQDRIEAEHQRLQRSTLRSNPQPQRREYRYNSGAGAKRAEREALRLRQRLEDQRLKQHQQLEQDLEANQYNNTTP